MGTCTVTWPGNMDGASFGVYRVLFRGLGFKDTGIQSLVFLWRYKWVHGDMQGYGGEGGCGLM